MALFNSLYFSVVIISGKNLPMPVPNEDTEEIARNIFQELTGLKPNKTEFKDCRRSGPGGKNILVEFLCFGQTSSFSKILSPVHKKVFHSKGIFINIPQPYFDRHLLFIARKMRKAGILAQVHVNYRAETVAVKGGRKYVIKRIQDLQSLSERNVKEFADGGSLSAGLSDSGNETLLETAE